MKAEKGKQYIPDRGRAMEIVEKAIEMQGTIDKEHRLILDETLPVEGPKRVRVIILLPGSPSMGKGKVVLVPFPFDDLSTTKVRPAVCLTDPVGPHRHVILAFISSRVPTQLKESDLKLDQAAVHFAQAGLKVSSVLRFIV